jgi:1-aminocyclopropane-1-carboxylate deaminase/D-cysteine desulfhydrase-like pyridoxal-dependent ACC family enzyme
MAALIAARHDGRLAADDRVVFLHTGGLPALFAGSFAEWLR